MNIDTGNHTKGVTFEFNKYNQPKLLDLKDTVASDIINAIIMKPGNLPSRPNDGVDFFDMIAYSEDDGTLGDQIKARIDNTCGTLPGGVHIQATDISMQQTTDGELVALLIVKLSIPQEDNTSLLGIALSKRKDIVRFNFDYIEM